MRVFIGRYSERMRTAPEIALPLSLDGGESGSTVGGSLPARIAAEHLDGGVHVFGRGNAFVDKRKRLARERMLHAVGQKARLVFLDQHRHAAAAAHEGVQPGAQGRVAALAQHHLHQRHQVRGHEEVQA